MKELADAELLEAHRRASKEAFAELVRRHIDWVYSVARRQVGDANLADDVTQAAFLVLWRKAPVLKAGRALSPWLFPVTVLAAKQVRRREHRRHELETKAAQMRDTLSMESSEWNELAPMLDALVGQLHSEDRQAVLLRYYEKKTFPEIGQAMQISEEAARKRVGRAIEQLRGLFARKGVTTGAVALAGLMETSLTQSAPASLLAAASSGNAATGIISIVEGTSAAMMWMTLKPVALVAASLLVALSIATAIMQLPLVAQVSSTPAAPATQPQKVLRGRTLNSQGQPVAGAKVMLIAAQEENLPMRPGRVIATTSTDGQGQFALNQTDDAEAFIVQAENYGITGAALPDDPASPFDITIRNPTSMTFKVLDPASAPAAGVKITVSMLSDTRGNRWQVSLPEELRNKLARASDGQGNCILTDLPQNAILRIDVLDERYATIDTGRSPLDKLATGPAPSIDGGEIRLEPAATISGTITYADTGKPAAGVMVSSYTNRSSLGGIAQTDAQGKYRMTQVRPGSVVVWLVATGEIGRRYAPEMRETQIQAGKEITGFDFKLGPGATVGGKVTDSTTQKPVAGVPISIVGNLASVPAITDATGVYEAHVAPGTHRIMVNHPLGLAAPSGSQKEIAVEVGQTLAADFSLALSPAATAKGRVVDSQGKPVAGAYVIPRTAGAGVPEMLSADRNTKIVITRTVPGARAISGALPGRSVKTGADGRFAVPLSRTDGIQLEAQKGASATAALVPVPDLSKEITLVLQKESTGTVQVHVQDETGLPVHNAKVTLGDTSGDRVLAMSDVMMVTGANGNCIIDELPLGHEYGFRVTTRGYAMASSPRIKVEAGKQVDVTVTVQRSDAILAGTVVDENNKPLHGIQVMMSNGPVRTSITDTAGKFRFDGLMVGQEVALTVRRNVGASKLFMFKAGMEDAVIVSRLSASEKRGVRARNSNSTGPEFMPEEQQAATTLRDMGLTITTDDGRGTPVVEVRMSRLVSMDDEHMKLIGSLISLEQLSISSSALTDAGAAELQKLPDLMSLNFTSNGLTDTGLKNLAGLKHLETLSLANTQITDAGMSQISQFDNLVNLTLGRVKITDAGLRELMPLKKLQTLNLVDTQVSDASVDVITQFTSLKRLNIRGTQITEQGAARITAAIPGIQITR